MGCDETVENSHGDERRYGKVDADVGSDVSGDVMDIFSAEDEESNCSPCRHKNNGHSDDKPYYQLYLWSTVLLGCSRQGTYQKDAWGEFAKVSHQHGVPTYCSRCTTMNHANTEYIGKYFLSGQTSYDKYEFLERGYARGVWKIGYPDRDMQGQAPASQQGQKKT